MMRILRQALPDLRQALLGIGQVLLCVGLMYAFFVWMIIQGMIPGKVNQFISNSLPGLLLALSIGITEGTLRRIRKYIVKFIIFIVVIVTVILLLLPQLVTQLPNKSLLIVADSWSHQLLISGTYGTIFTATGLLFALILWVGGSRINGTGELLEIAAFGVEFLLAFAFSIIFGIDGVLPAAIMVLVTSRAFSLIQPISK